MISLVIPSYNRKHSLPRCIESILAQTYTDFEVIVVDDGSTDGTEELFKTQFTDKRLRFFRFSENRGSTVARNYGLEQVQGDYFMMWDSDDELYKDALQTLVDATREFTTAVTISAPTDCYRGEEKMVYPVFAAGEVTLERILCRNLPNNEKIRLSKTVFASDVRYHARNIDFLFNVELREKGYWHHLSQSLGKVNLSSDEVSLTRQRKRPNAAASRERTPYLVAFLEKYGVTLRAACPVVYCLYAYGTSVGLLLIGKKKQAISLLLSALKTSHAKRSHWLFFLFACVPFSPWLLQMSFQIKLKFLSKK